MRCRHSFVRTTAGIMVCTECGAESGPRHRRRRRRGRGRRGGRPRRRRRAPLLAAALAFAVLAAIAAIVLAPLPLPPAALDAFRQIEPLAESLGDGAEAAAGAAAGAAADARERAGKVLPSLEGRRIGEAAASSAIHNATNEARAAAGLAPLDRDGRLDGIARGHAADMAARGYFAHDTPGGLDPTGRAAAAGYACEKRVGAVVWTGVAENIYTSGPHGGYTAGMAAGAVDSWMDSPGHRQNILDGRYDRLGVGVAIGAGGDFYAVQNFC